MGPPISIGQISLHDEVVEGSGRSPPAHLSVGNLSNIRSRVSIDRYLEAKRSLSVTAGGRLVGSRPAITVDFAVAALVANLAEVVAATGAGVNANWTDRPISTKLRGVDLSTGTTLGGASRLGFGLRHTCINKGREHDDGPYVIMEIYPPDNKLDRDGEAATRHWLDCQSR